MRILPLALLLAACAGDKDGTTTSETGPTDTSTTDTQTTPATLGEALTVDGVDYYVVTVTEQPDPNYFRLQVNYGTEEQLGDTPTEKGQNSTFAVVLSMTDAPGSSGSFTWTSNRFPTDPGEVSGYMSFFFNTGHPHEGLNFLSPDGGTLDVTVDGGGWVSPIATSTWTDEAKSGTTVSVEGTVEAAW